MYTRGRGNVFGRFAVRWLQTSVINALLYSHEFIIFCYGQQRPRANICIFNVIISLLIYYRLMRTDIGECCVNIGLPPKHAAAISLPLFVDENDVATEPEEPSSTTRTHTEAYTDTDTSVRWKTRILTILTIAGDKLIAKRLMRNDICSLVAVFVSFFPFFLLFRPRRAMNLSGRWHCYQIGKSGAAKPAPGMASESFLKGEDQTAPAPISTECGNSVE